MTPSWRILEGDCRTVLRSLPERSVHTVVTSPPYFGLRDYGTAGQIGLEPTPDEFVAALVAVFRGVRRVLREDGTAWLNLGDSYATGGGRSVGRNDSGKEILGRTVSSKTGGATGKVTVAGCKDKDLVGIPWAVAFALRADGWYLRSDIIWSKPNPMPESVTDRPTKAHEYVFLLSKGPRYFYDADAIREDNLSARTPGEPNVGYSIASGRVDGGTHHNGSGFGYVEAGRNKRSVWTVATQPYAGAHFATFPPKLIEPCVLAGAPERACGVCGAPWEKIIHTDNPSKAHADANTLGWANTHSKTSNAQSSKSLHRQPGGVYSTAKVVGFEPSCDHGDGTAAGVVLDPFAGAGTTGLVALRHNRSFIGIELNPAYAAMARDRIRDDAPLLNTHAELAA